MRDEDERKEKREKRTRVRIHAEFSCLLSLPSSLQNLLLIFEARQTAAFVVTVGRGVMAQMERLAADLLVWSDLRHIGRVVRPAQGGSLMAVASFR